MSIVLRNYQLQAVDAIRQAYRDGYKCPLLRLDCGGGKTVIFSYITHGAAAKCRSTMIVAHRRELISQISLSLARFAVTHRVIAPANVVRSIKIAQFRAFGRSFVDNTSKTIVGSVQTIVRRFNEISEPDLIILDEAHHVVADTMWGKVLDQYPRALGLKVTATPQRLDRKGLGKGEGGYADTMIEGPPMAWLIEQGFLSQYRMLTTAMLPDLSKVATRMGDYDKKQVEERMDKPAIIGNAIQHWRKHADGLCTVVYCVSRKASDDVAAQFRAAGIPAEHFDGDTPEDDRVRIVRDFADGKIKVLCNVGLLTEGFDLASIAQKDVTIDCVVDLAPTQSLTLYIQKVCRCLRPRPGKMAVILDHVGNYLRHGLPDMEREWSLNGEKKRTRSASDEPDVTIATCPECFTVHEPAPQCPACGYMYPAKVRKLIQEEGELVEITASEQMRLKLEQEEAKRRESLERKRQEAMADTLDALIELAKSRNYRYPEAWAKHRIAGRARKKAFTE